ncbi:hypothetical protein ACFYMW_30235 [Streptomyces sp. NPDC006692]|uniref:hypothetical protein n=1 Tax=Streptomyces sp. NPDC006692 TaxID=3364758 RepID=UPI0036BDD9AE
MKHALRTGLAAAVAATALAVAVPPAIAANAKTDQPAHIPCFGTLDTRVPANPNQISAAAYNQARSILAGAGSQTAAKSHPVHGTRSVPVRYGTSLLACSRDEFRHNDRNAPLTRSGMTPYHWLAVHDAARAMGLDRW